MPNTIIITFAGTTTSVNSLTEKDAKNFYLPASAEDTIASIWVIDGVRAPNFDNVGVWQHWKNDPPARP